ncbi:MAG: T9SS type A sorting domain-containing protein [Bacteroidia bacterium]
MKFISILFFCICITGFSQNNLIHNPGFEDNDADEPSSPCKKAQLENAQVWEDDHNFVFVFDHDQNGPCTYLPCDNSDCNACVLLHSPDWFKYNPTNAFNYYFKEKTGVNSNGNVITPVSARSGYGYAGMSTGEIIEQKFFNSNQIIGGKKYTFSMYVRIPNELTQYLPSFGLGEIINGSPIAAFDYNTSSVFNLNVYLSTQKIKYANKITTCNNANTWDDNFKDLSFNHIVQIKNFQISPSEYPYGQWHKLTFEFECPKNHNYDWIGIEQSYDSNTSSNNGYIFIDDVSLVESCELSCYPTSGIPNPIIGTPTSYNVPLQVSNLNNVEKLKLEILPITGQGPIYTANYNYTNGINTNIYWNGEILWGGDAAIGLYICKLTCENECGTHEFAQQFVNVGAMAPYAPNTPANKIEERIINPCCLIDYTLHDKTFNFSRTYQMKENIFVNSNVHNVASGNLKLIAGKNIEILGEFDSNSSSEFSASIVECADAHRLINNVLTDKDFVFYDQSSESDKKTEMNEIFISVSPNPSKGSFFIKDEKKNTSFINKIIIRDIYGKLIYSYANKNIIDGFTINLSECNNGVYFIEYTDAQELKKYLKIIKQE